VLFAIEGDDVQEHGREEPRFTSTQGQACQRVGAWYLADKGDLGDGRRGQQKENGGGNNEHHRVSLVKRPTEKQGRDNSSP
jgi:hypothetical protein